MKTIAALAGLLAIVIASTAFAAGSSPVVRYVDHRYGPILATPERQALYFWSVEKSDHRVHCRGSCAKAWPPLIVKRTVPRRIAGIKGSFGTIRRPDGQLQLTFNRLLLYTYAHEGPKQVLCDNVGGWFVARL
jgi:predicted lipoprotein with Yx(FWY)xxD motif